ncbi:glycerophosphodiester phosphodiesterase family protein [Bifidobacterium leontopitheci]|uniref:Glycerophosphodiester phosphodiesterase n=1 Tax=Bifidobacterium leontopitheci TaxID=2650774 RepID=A0A6I1GGS7_9BIFI|nr:glycerophosphodiester phosphodiesterase family protein [Bifidobacterium leontopitheci]KAB7789912.1 glycerophosphodiester phosphodiesterase [Bifidobacterium leontopitheci]
MVNHRNNNPGRARRSHLGGKLALAGLTAAAAAVWAIKPRSFSDRQRNFVPSIPDVWYAHRGLHDAGSGLTPEYAAGSGEYVALARRSALKAGYGTADFAGSIAPENSLAAFAAACEAGYGIELDLQLTKDGHVVVVHDEDLLRVAGDPRKVADLTYDELTRIPLFPAPAKPGDAEAAPLADPVAASAKTPTGYYQHVPLFSDVLRVVAGRAPLIVEYKFADNVSWTDRDTELMEKGDQLLQAYSGPYVIESFHPGAVNWYKEHRPEVCRGQLAESATPGKAGAGMKEWLAGLLVFNWMSRPDFVAYDWHGGPLPQMRATRWMGAVPVSWTVRSRDELDECRDFFDYHIFEAFVPDEV